VLTRKMWIPRQGVQCRFRHQLKLSMVISVLSFTVNLLNHHDEVETSHRFKSSSGHMIREYGMSGVSQLADRMLCCGMKICPATKDRARASKADSRHQCCQIANCSQATTRWFAQFVSVFLVGFHYCSMA
jgi:hypothetical protein